MIFRAQAPFPQSHSAEIHNPHSSNLSAACRKNRKKGCYPACLTTERSDILQFEKRCEARQNEIRDGSVLAHVTKRIAVITPHRALVASRFLLNITEETDRIWPNPTTPCYLTNYCRSAETGEMFGLFRRRRARASDGGSERVPRQGGTLDPRRKTPYP